MRPSARIILAGLGLIALVGAGLWWKGGVGSPPTEPRDRAGGEAWRPELTLSVNGSRRTTVTPGAPLVLKLMLRNGQAARAALAAGARERLKEELEERVQAGELSRQEAEDVLRRDPVPAPGPALVITLAPDGFSFQREGPPGATTLPWRPKMVDPPAPTSVTLDQTRSAWVTFVVAPDETASAAKEAYRVRASFENRAAGQWQGRIVSGRVTITVAQPSGAPTASEQKKQQLLLGEYFLARKDYDQALVAARQALAIHPQSIDGLILLGNAQEARGDVHAALGAYEQALSEFDQRYPDAGHPPDVLMERIWRTRDKLGIQLPAR